MRRLVMEKDGTIFTGDERFRFSNLEKLFHSEPFGIIDASYDEEELCFILVNVEKEGKIEYKLELSPEHKSLLERGIFSPEVQILFDLVKEKQERNRLRKMDGKVTKTGEYPSSKSELEEYLAYLIKELDSTEGDLILEGFFAISPVILAGLTILFGKAGIVSNDSFTLINFLAFTGSIMCGFGCIAALGETLTGGSHPTQESVYSRMKKKRVEHAEYNNRILRVKEKLKALEENDEKTSEELENANNYPEIISEASIEKTENDKITEYRSVFLQDIIAVRDLIARLPMEEREEFIKELNELLENYMSESSSIIENKIKKVTCGSSAYIYDLNRKMHPFVESLKERVEVKLSTCEITEGLISDCQEVKESINALSTDSLGYTDGWTDGYTDDLTSGGVAYAAPKKVYK